QGDGNLRGTERCRREYVCGIVIAILRPGRRPVDCTRAAFARRSRCWRRAPYLVRRLVLAVYRRVRFL
ncbi:MAG: hypothetical protein J5871_00430, partial [Bacteroidales bacterium]|nr:hypothetical protein [Bacteroidales bacterium]